MIIGFAGRIGSGKDTCAHRLLDRYGFSRVSFAEALKVEVATKFNRTLRAHLLMVNSNIRAADAAGKMTEVAWEAQIHKILWLERDGVTRAILQEMGTDVRRADDPEYWIKQWDKAVDKAGEGAQIVVTDVRFPNELDALRRRGGKLVRVERPSLPPLGKTPHPSENSLDYFKDWDAVLMNVGSVADLWGKIDHVAKSWGLTQHVDSLLAEAVKP